MVVLGPGWTVEDFRKEFGDDPSLRVIANKDEWDQWTKKGDPVLHIELRKKAGTLIVVPASVEIVGEFANGLASSLIVRNGLGRLRFCGLGTSAPLRKYGYWLTGRRPFYNTPALPLSSHKSRDSLHILKLSLSDPLLFNNM